MLIWKVRSFKLSINGERWKLKSCQYSRGKCVLWVIKLKIIELIIRRFNYTCMVRDQWCNHKLIIDWRDSQIGSWTLGCSIVQTHLRRNEIWFSRAISHPNQPPHRKLVKRHFNHISFIGQIKTLTGFFKHRRKKHHFFLHSSSFKNN